MTESQKNGDWTGSYIDNDNFSWNWTCYNSRPKPVENNTEYIEVIKEKKYIPPGLFDTMKAENQWIEDSIAWIYWSDMAWIGGYAV